MDRFIITGGWHRHAGIIRTVSPSPGATDVPYRHRSSILFVGGCETLSAVDRMGCVLGPYTTCDDEESRNLKILDTGGGRNVLFVVPEISGKFVVSNGTACVLLDFWKGRAIGMSSFISKLCYFRVVKRNTPFFQVVLRYHIQKISDNCSHDFSCR